MRPLVLVLLVVAACAHAPASAPSASAPLYTNLYVTRPTTHVVVRSGQDGRPARLVFADPRGNTGVGLWSVPFARGTAGLRAEGTPAEVTWEGVRGVAVRLSGPPELRFDRYFLGNVRELRDAEQNAEGPRVALLDEARRTVASAPPSPVQATMLARIEAWRAPPARVEGGRLVVARAALGSGARYRTEIVPGAGTTVAVEGRALVVRAAGRTQFEVRAFLDRPALAPIARLFREGDGGEMGEALRFLSSGEKLLAGSWQYLTYFGRDTMISASLLAHRASPEFLGMAVSSVLDRVGPDGIPAHEEDIGDQATFRNLPALLARVRSGAKLEERDLVALETPVFDTKMIDGEFLLPQLVERFVAQADDVGETFRADRVAALGRVFSRIATLTAQGDFIAFKNGEKVGDWRDSEEGNGLGAVPLDVSAYLVPSALEAMAALAKHPRFPKAALLAQPGVVLDPAELQARRDAWRKRSAAAFTVTMDAAVATKRLRDALAALGPEEAAVFGRRPLLGGGPPLAEASVPVTFAAIALDAAKKPIPVQSSDGIFDLFYGTPSREEVLAHAQTLFQPYPLGLMTPVGVATSNAAFSDRPEDKALFGKGKYHGSRVVWGWQQPMLKQGLRKQLARFANDAEVTRVLTEGMRLVADAERHVGAVGRKAEAWAWQARDGKIVAVPYGADAGDATEANDRQLWTIAGSLGSE